MFGTVWSDHANEIALAYTGTGALKTDFTRTGKRTKMGLLDDGYKSVMRYLKNNFLDGTRQVRITQYSCVCLCCEGLRASCLRRTPSTS